MKAGLILVGKTADSRIAALVEDYAVRIGHYMPFSITVVPELKNTKAVPFQRQKELEGDRILRFVGQNDCVVLLDEGGKQYSSLEMAEWLRRKQQSLRRLIFVIGGAYGFSKAVYERADELFSLSRMTFSHQIVRLIFAEQLYRACTIIKGEPYHHG